MRSTGTWRIRRPFSRRSFRRWGNGRIDARMRCASVSRSWRSWERAATSPLSILFMTFRLTDYILYKLAPGGLPDLIPSGVAPWAAHCATPGKSSDSPHCSRRSRNPASTRASAAPSLTLLNPSPSPFDSANEAAVGCDLGELGEGWHGKSMGGKRGGAPCRHPSPPGRRALTRRRRIRGHLATDPSIGSTGHGGGRAGARLGAVGGEPEVSQDSLDHGRLVNQRHEAQASRNSCSTNVEAPHRPAAMRCGRGLLARRADGITGGRAAERSEGTLDPVEHRAENRPAMAGVAATACNRTPKPRTTAGAFSIYLAADFWPWPASTAARRDTSRPTASIRRFLSSVTICPQHLYPRRGRLAPQGRRSGSKNGCLARWTVLD